MGAAAASPAKFLGLVGSSAGQMTQLNTADPAHGAPHRAENLVLV